VGDPEGLHVDVAALTAYAGQLGFYETETDKFSRLVDQADVTDEAWGVMGAWAKQSYADRLDELRSLMADMKQGVASLATKISDTAAVYAGEEEDTVIRFGEHEAMIDGPLGETP
jgi:hypothetical protein